jgi:phage head maturation protease
MTVIPPDTQWARDLLTSIDRGDVDQMSFGFRTILDEWEQKKNESIRTLKEVELVDVSPVTYPAYPDTSVALRSLEEHKESIEQKPSEGDPSEEQESQPEATLDVTALARQRHIELNEKLLEELEE